MRDYFFMKRHFLIPLGAFAILIIFYVFFVSAPSNFVPGTTVEIEKGVGLHSVSLKLKNANVIRSRVVFEAFAVLYGAESRIVAGNYTFEKELKVWHVASRISGGGRFAAPVIVTIPEGFDINQIADAVSLKLKNFNKALFLTTAKSKEGYLFPDTYYFFSADTEQQVIKSMSDNFNKKIEPLRDEIIASGHTEEEIIIMASIIERESKGDQDRALVSGILWKRFSIGMRLQTDAAPQTYKTIGLPKSPIANPGLESIKASIHPESSSYLYYLHDKDGNIHYAKNFEEHKRNIKKYLVGN